MKDKYSLKSWRFSYFSIFNIFNSCEEKQDEKSILVWLIIWTYLWTVTGCIAYHSRVFWKQVESPLKSS